MRFEGKRQNLPARRDWLMILHMRIYSLYVLARMSLNLFDCTVVISMTFCLRLCEFFLFFLFAFLNVSFSFFSSAACWWYCRCALLIGMVSLSGSFEVANIIHICVQYAHFIYIHFSRVVRFYSCSRIFFGSFCIFSKFQVTSFSTAQPNPNIVSCCSMICHSYIRTDF